jgi:hypothetical protein
MHAVEPVASGSASANSEIIVRGFMVLSLHGCVGGFGAKEQLRSRSSAVRTA